jgi:hypothetical protein
MVPIIEAVAEDIEIAVWGSGLCAAEPGPQPLDKVPPGTFRGRYYERFA